MINKLSLRDRRTFSLSRQNCSSPISVCRHRPYVPSSQHDSQVYASQRWYRPLDILIHWFKNADAKISSYLLSRLNMWATRLGFLSSRMKWMKKLWSYRMVHFCFNSMIKKFPSKIPAWLVTKSYFVPKTFEIQYSHNWYNTWILAKIEFWARKTWILPCEACATVTKWLRFKEEKWGCASSAFIATWFIINNGNNNIIIVVILLW